MAAIVGKQARFPLSAVAQDTLPPVAELLIEGGDDRIGLSPGGRENRYGCAPFPDPALLDFASSTASVISEAGFAAASRLHQHINQALGTASPADVYAHELARVRRELLALCDVSDLPGLDVIFAASGTDLHLLCARLVTAAAPSALVVLMEPAETGSGVPAAVAGRHFGSRTARGHTVMAGAPFDTGSGVETATVALRLPDGQPRNREEVDAEVAQRVSQAVSAGRRVLLTLIDVSKTGLIAPSPACALALRETWPEQVDVLVDACQFRMAPATLRAYLEQGFMVALTGSKFLTGPTFSGALLVPDAVARRLRTHALPSSVAAYSSAAEWPSGWAAAATLDTTPNFGLLLRWEAALEELKAFRRVPEHDVTEFLTQFAATIQHRLAVDPRFQPLPVPPLDRQRHAAADAWDVIPTIFPFLLYRPRAIGGRQPLNREETARVHRLLRIELPGIDNPIGTLRCHLGQPVACGERDGIPVSALRLCVSARLVADALSRGKADAVIQQALAALDKAALLAS